MSKERVYYELLTRTDHPVFEKDFSETLDINSPLNSIMNLVFARQLARVRALAEDIRTNLYPDTVTELTIADWETEYFGFTKPGLSLAQRREELLIKFNKRFKMNLQDVIDLSKSIVGRVPVVTRSVSRRGWVMGSGLLGVSTTLAGGGSADVGLYLVYFTAPVDSALLAKLDERLTIIEKAGSRHSVRAPIQHWILGRTALGINTTLGA